MNKQYLKTAIEYHTQMGLTGLQKLKTKKPEARPVVEFIEKYIRENYTRCFPGELIEKESELSRLYITQVHHTTGLRPASNRAREKLETRGGN